MDLNKTHGRKSIFRSLFVPMIIIMILQAVIFYCVAVYGGIEESLSQNVVDILNEKLSNRKNEIETRFNNRWTSLDDCIEASNARYELYEAQNGTKPFVGSQQLQIDYLADSADDMIRQLRFCDANGVFLILNDEAEQNPESLSGKSQKYGICIRDMDQESNYTGTEDLLLERSPSSVVDMLGCSLDSWWEAKYSFSSEEDGSFYYAPLNAAWARLSKKTDDLAYLSQAHRISGSDPEVVSYSVPLLSKDGYPYGVLGVEMSVKYLASLLPNKELNEADRCCYVLALQKSETRDYTPIVGTGALFSRCFGDMTTITRGETASTGGFTLFGRDGTELYAAAAELEVYNNNSPFESRSLVLLAMVESSTLFSYLNRIKSTLMVVSLLSLILGVLGLAFVSRRFAAPITALAERVRAMDAKKSDFSLGRLGITEIDQLVDSIEELNSNVSKNSARTEFFSRMSHDMRTPMNAIISFSSPEMLEDADVALKDDYLGKIHASGIYLLGLINEVLDMTKIESNMTKLNASEIFASQMFDTTIPIIEKLAQKKNITFSCNIRIPKELRVSVDTQHLDQIVMNLLSNAVKFTPTGGTVLLSAETDKGAQGELCRIVVSDTGIGISDEFMKRLYLPFEQENGSHEGTGLGLSIAKKLVELMGGTIECESCLDEGTTFTVTLPLTPVGPLEQTSAQRKNEADEGTSALKGRHVLVCEDNAINIMIVRQLLERVGISIDVAENGESGVKRFAQSKPGEFDAILMDIRMPVMNGIDATLAIRAMTRSDASEIPIIAMTADAFEEDAEHSIAAGMNEHLSKPVEPKKLYDTLLKHIV